MLAAIITISSFENKQGVLFLFKRCQDIWALTASSGEKSGSSQYRLPKYCSLLLLFLIEHNLICVSSLSISLRPKLHVEAALFSRSLCSPGVSHRRSFSFHGCVCCFTKAPKTWSSQLNIITFSVPLGKPYRKQTVFISHTSGEAA